MLGNRGRAPGRRRVALAAVLALALALALAAASFLIAGRAGRRGGAPPTLPWPPGHRNIGAALLRRRRETGYYLVK